MAKEMTKAKIDQTLNMHLNTIRDTLQILDQAPYESLVKVNWKDVITMGEQISKHATTAGMLLSGETPKVNYVEEIMSTFFNALQGFILLSHRCIAGAGPTLSSHIHALVKQVVDCSFTLMEESVSFYGSHSKKKRFTIPQLVGKVWDACSAINKAPSTNIIAIGRAMAQVANVMKDVHREMEEFKEASSGNSEEVEVMAEGEPDDSDNSWDEDLGKDLSPEEMKIVHSAREVVAKTQVAIKELIRCITSLVNQENSKGNNNFVDSLEKLLKQSKEIGLQIDEIGACLYPPQEIIDISAASKKLSSIIDEMQTELDNLKGSSESFEDACTSLRNSLRQLQCELCCSSATELEPKLKGLALTN